MSSSKQHKMNSVAFLEVLCLIMLLEGHLFIYLNLQVLCIHSLVSRSVLYGFCVKLGVSLCLYMFLVLFILLLFSVCLFVLSYSGLFVFILPIVITCLICNERAKGGEIRRI